MDKKDKCYIAAFIIGVLASIAWQIWLFIEAPVLWLWGQILSIFGAIFSFSMTQHIVRRDMGQTHTDRVVKTIFEDK